MLQGWSLLAAIAGGAWLLSKTKATAPASGVHFLGPPVQLVTPPFRANPIVWEPPVSDPAGRLDVGRWGPGSIQPVPATRSDGAPNYGSIPATRSDGAPNYGSIPATRSDGAPNYGSIPATTSYGAPNYGSIPPTSERGAQLGVDRGHFAPTHDPGNAAHATSRARLPRGKHPARIALDAATNATPAQLVRIPDTSGPPSVGGGWAPASAPGRGIMPWDSSHVPVVHAIAPRPVPLPHTLPTPALGPGRGTGRHVPPPPPVAADPVGPTRTTLLPWDHPIAGPRMPELTGTRVPVTDAPSGAAAWYGSPAMGAGALSSASGGDVGVAKTPTLLSTIVQLLGRPAAAAPAPLVRGQLSRSDAPW